MDKIKKIIKEPLLYSLIFGFGICYRIGFDNEYPVIQLLFAIWWSLIMNEIIKFCINISK